MGRWISSSCSARAGCGVPCDSASRPAHRPSASAFRFPAIELTRCGRIYRAAPSRTATTMFNLMKTAILMAAITALFMLLGQMWGGRSGMMLALVIALGLNFFSYWFSDKIVLRMTNAREVDEQTAPQFVRTVRELA